MTPRQFENVSGGYFQRKEKDLKAAMILNRQLMHVIHLPNMKPADRKTPVEKLWPFAWEKRKSVIVDLEAEIAAVESQNLQFWNDVDKRKGLT